MAVLSKRGGMGPLRLRVPLPGLQRGPLRDELLSVVHQLHGDVGRRLRQRGQRLGLDVV